jgi:hypothetical protein
VYFRSNVKPGSGMDGDSIDGDACDILEYCAYNSCCDPPLNSDFHSTTTDAVLHTTLTTTGAVGWSKINLDSLDQKISL